MLRLCTILLFNDYFICTLLVKASSPPFHPPMVFHPPTVKGMCLFLYAIFELTNWNEGFPFFQSGSYIQKYKFTQPLPRSIFSLVPPGRLHLFKPSKFTPFTVLPVLCQGKWITRFVSIDTS